MAYHPQYITPRSAEQLRNRPTYYEVMAYLPNGEQQRLGFTAQTSKRALLSFAQEHGEWLLGYMTEADANTVPSYSRTRGWDFGSVRVALSGRTEFQLATAPAA